MKKIITTLCIALALNANAQTNKVNKTTNGINKTNNDIKRTTNNTKETIEDSKELIVASKELLNAVFANKKKKAVTEAGVSKVENEKTENAIQEKLTPEAALLFKDVKTKLTATEKNKIAQDAGCTLSRDKSSFSIEGQDIEMTAHPLDITNDKTEEVFIVTSSSFLYGNTGQGFNFLIKDKTGIYKSIFDLAGIPSLIITPGKVMPDIEVGGPGMVFPIWAWTGVKYDLAKNYSKKNKTVKDMVEMSDEYQATIK